MISIAKSFNGATAFQRWKPCWRFAIGNTGNSFNGATAFQRWKPMLISGKPVSGLIAFNGATAFQRWKQKRSASARHSYSPFNGATAFQRWKPGWHCPGVSERSCLQWGHRLSAMETGLALPRGVREVLPSMGPPPFSDGNTPRGTAIDQDRLPSMGPPPFSDGNLIGSMLTIAWQVILQWGHRLSAMETALTSGASFKWVCLQWGHRLSAMETL